MSLAYFQIKKDNFQENGKFAITKNYLGNGNQGEPKITDGCHYYKLFGLNIQEYKLKGHETG